MKLIYFLPVFLFFIILVQPVYATNCIESMSCPPVNPLDVLNIFDVWFGTGMTVMAMALIIGIITVSIYVRNRSLPMLTILGMYEIAAFSSIITSHYVSSQYQIAVYVLGIGIATAIIMAVLRMVKE